MRKDEKNIPTYRKPHKVVQVAFQLPFAEVRILNSSALCESEISFTGFLHHTQFSAAIMNYMTT